MQIIEKINLDMAHEYSARHRFKQFDTNTRVLEFFLTNNRKPLNLRNVDAYVYFKKSDNRVVFVKVNEEDYIDNSTFRVTLTNNILASVGQLRAEVTLMTKATDDSEAKILTTNKLNFFVEAILRDDSAIESTNEFVGLQDILDKIESIDDIISKLDNVHEHSNLDLLETITQSRLLYWDNKAEKDHEHSEYALKTDIENASNEINQTIYVVEENIAKVEENIANTDVQVKKLTVDLEDLAQEVRNGLVYPLSEEDLDDIISFLD